MSYGEIVRRLACGFIAGMLISLAYDIQTKGLPLFSWHRLTHSALKTAGLFLFAWQEYPFWLWLCGVKR